MDIESRWQGFTAPIHGRMLISAVTLLSLVVVLRSGAGREPSGFAPSAGLSRHLAGS